MRTLIFIIKLQVWTGGLGLLFSNVPWRHFTLSFVQRKKNVFLEQSIDYLEKCCVIQAFLISGSL